MRQLLVQQELGNQIRFFLLLFFAFLILINIQPLCVGQQINVLYIDIALFKSCQVSIIFLQDAKNRR